MRKTFNLIAPAVLCLAVGFVASRFQADSLQTWYPSLAKPSLTPPNIVFPVVWTLLYICMGLSVGLILNSATSFRRQLLVVIFIMQLALNFCWSLIFFYFQNPAGGLVVIILLVACLILYAVKAWPISQAASALFWPYIFWTAFATYINAYIALNN